jgi:hypothetical protein
MLTWSQSVRDKEFLVEMRLKNHEPEPESTGKSREKKLMGILKGKGKEKATETREREEKIKKERKGILKKTETRGRRRAELKGEQDELAASPYTLYEETEEEGETSQPRQASETETEKVDEIINEEIEEEQSQSDDASTTVSTPQLEELAIAPKIKVTTLPSIPEDDSASFDSSDVVEEYQDTESVSD